MKSLILAAALVIPALAFADAHPDNSGCPDLADGSRSMAQARDNGLDRQSAQAMVAKVQRGKSEYEKSIAKMTINFVFDNPLASPNVIYWAVYGICKDATEVAVGKSSSM